MSLECTGLWLRGDIELKTTRVMDSAPQVARFERDKLLKWWAQSFSTAGSQLRSAHGRPFTQHNRHAFSLLCFFFTPPSLACCFIWCHLVSSSHGLTDHQYLTA